VDLTERLRTPERRHPWEAARARFFKDVLARSALLSAPIRVLDVGSGDGWLAGQLAAVLHPDSAITCWDSAYTDELTETLAARVRGVRRFVKVRPAGTFDLLLLLDVLEHVEDDAHFLRDLESSLAAGGHALLSVPAWQQLFGRHDSRLNHFRRYLPEDARALLRCAGLEVLESGGLFHSLLAARALQELGARLRRRTLLPHAGEWHAGPVLTAAVRAAFAADTQVSEWLALVKIEAPGLSWWALCRKPS
jgi:SAM-dependent methyltransferase